VRADRTEPPVTRTLPLMLRTVAATRYVTPFREGGSLPGLCEADDDGLYVVKFHGAGQGPKALIAEVIVGELARALGLPIPELVLVELDAQFAAGEPHWEVKELLDRSPGTNLGVDFLPGALGFAPAVEPVPKPEMAAAFVWLDALTLNVDRTPRNPNLLVWHRRLYGIDHGAALYMQHRWEDALGDPEHARRPFSQVRDHVLLPFASSIEEADAGLALQVTDDLLRELVSAVPDAWLDGDAAFATLDDNRMAYVDYLRRRLAAPRAFVEEAERARTGA
jgi:hypothetical protein